MLGAGWSADGGPWKEPTTGIRDNRKQFLRPPDAAQREPPNGHQPPTLRIGRRRDEVRGQRRRRRKLGAFGEPRSIGGCSPERVTLEPVRVGIMPRLPE
jgi:hypothetical protein